MKVHLIFIFQFISFNILFPNSNYLFNLSTLNFMILNLVFSIILKSQFLPLNHLFLSHILIYFFLHLLQLFQNFSKAHPFLIFHLLNHLKKLYSF